MNGEEKSAFLLNNIKGIGPAKVEKIANSLSDVDDLLNFEDTQENREKLTSVVGYNLANSIVTQLLSIKKQNEIAKKMISCGMSSVAAINLVKSELLLKAYTEDPYVVGAQNNIDFEINDKFAHILVSETNPDESPDMYYSRMIYFINYILLMLENSGHTFVYLSQLVKKMNTYQKQNEYLPDCYSESSVMLYLMDTSLIKVAPSYNLKNWKIYRKTTADLESDIAYHIKRLANNEAGYPSKIFSSSDIDYDDIQLGAINSAAKSGLKIITGPPGSGKTAVIKGIISYFEQTRENPQIVLCAPTGRAAKHMSEISNRKASTVHKLLGLRKDSNFQNREKLHCDLLICDEASMLNLEITYELLSRIPTGATIYFIGDKDQLPAVGPGNVLHDVINSGVIPVYQLTKVYRQDGIILENAHDINAGIVPTQTSQQYQQKTFDNASKLKSEVISWFKKTYDKKEPFETQILIPSYKTECGIDEINNSIQALSTEPYIYYSKIKRFKKFDKILMTKNSKTGEYQNGSVGLFLANRGDNFLVELDGEEVTLPKKAIDDMTLGYAVSVHKSQGSEYKHVLFCLPSEPSTMLKRNILYTGITRAKQDILICEMKNAIKTSIENNPELFMQTSLKDKLQKNDGA